MALLVVYYLQGQIVQDFVYMIVQYDGGLQFTVNEARGQPLN